MSRPDFVAPGHTFDVEPDWLVLPKIFRPICDSCLRQCDKPHDVTKRPTALLAPKPAEPRRYWGD